MAGEPESNGGGTITNASMGLTIANAFLRAAQTLGLKISEGVTRSGGHLGNAATVAAVVYEVSREEGLKHKGERITAGMVSPV